MTKSIADRYLDALKSMEGWVSVSEWATKVGELNPDLLAKADSDALNQNQDTTGLRELAARISSNIARDAYRGQIEIDTSERPRRVRFITKEEHEDHVNTDAEDDVAPLKRDERIRRDISELSQHEKYRMEEFQSIAKHLKQFNGLDFELDHARALLNKDEPGKHHPDNLQFLLKAHNAKKSDNNWVRFTFDEQVEYINTVVKLQSLLSDRTGVHGDVGVLGSLLERLRNVYE